MGRRFFSVATGVVVVALAGRVLAAVRVGLVDVGVADLFDDGLFDGRFVDATVRLGQVDGLAPVVRPVEFAVRRQRRVWRTFAAHGGAEHQAHHDRHEAKHQHEHAQIPVLIDALVFSFLFSIFIRNR